MKLKMEAGRLRKPRAARSARIVLSIDERDRLVSFVALLIQIDKRVNAKRKAGKAANTARRKCGPLFLLRTHLSLCYRTRIYSMDEEHYDRYSHFNTQEKSVSHYSSGKIYAQCAIDS
jgi:hypothetical protein